MNQEIKMLLSEPGYTEDTYEEYVATFLNRLRIKPPGSNPEDDPEIVYRIGENMRLNLWREMHPDRWKAIKKRYYDKIKHDPVFIEKRKIHDRQWRLDNPDKVKLRNSRRIKFKGVTVSVGKNPRTGKCSMCGIVGRTEIHHIKYHEDNPLKDIIEVCAACHRKRERLYGESVSRGKQ